MSKDKQIKVFKDEESAKTWMFEYLESIGEGYIDCYRFRFYGDVEARKEYNMIFENSYYVFDEEIQVGDQLAEIGCNFGH